jgi:GcrA cell cycle regulator
MTIDWNDERIKDLIALWNEGLSTSEIGNRLGVTKNAVIGKVHRLGLPKRQSPIQRKPKAEPAKAKIIKLEHLSAGMCCWPEGEPGTPGFRFCGHKAIPDKPYCAEHCARAYVKASRDRDRKSTAAA